MKEQDMFSPSMLYDYTDFARVLNTLSKLSNCAKALEKEIEGMQCITVISILTLVE